MHRVAIYTRISKDRAGLSENTGIQLRECLEYAADAGWEVVAQFEENDISASKYSKRPRPLYEALVRMIEANKVDIILSTEGERLHRQPKELDRLLDLAERTSLSRITHTSGEDYDLSTANGIYNVRQNVNAGERESRKISERQKRKKLAQAREGKPGGGRRPYGYQADMVTIKEDEAAVLRDMAHKIIHGWGFKEIAYDLNLRGVRTTTGKLWYPITVRNLLQKKRYIGIREHLDVEYQAMWPGVFDPATWEQLQLTMQLRREARGDIPQARKYLLTGHVFCGKCGKPLNGATKRDHPGRPLRRTYHCRVQGDTKREGGCGGVTRNADALEWWIKEAVIARLDTPTLGDLLHKADGNGEMREALDAHKAQALRLGALIDDYATRNEAELTPQQFARAKQSAEAELERLRVGVQDIAKSRQAAHILKPGESVRETWESSGDPWRRQLIGLLVDRIEVLPGSDKPLMTLPSGQRVRFAPHLIRVQWRV